MPSSSAWFAAGGAFGAGAVWAWGVCHPSAQLFGPTVRRSAPGTIALTFDDGPNPHSTPQVLDLLDRYGARGTFFVLGTRARAYPELLRAIAVRGHAVGNHTDTHPRLVWQTVPTIERELRRCQEAIADAAGLTPALHRPPFGYRHPRLDAVARRLGLTQVVMWTVMTRDWTGLDGVIRARVSRVRSRDIVVMHDGDHRDPAAGRQATIRALAEWLPRWRDAGLQMITVDGRSPP